MLREENIPDTKLGSTKSKHSDKRSKSVKKNAMKTQEELVNKKLAEMSKPLEILVNHERPHSKAKIPISKNLVRIH